MLRHLTILSLRGGSSAPRPPVHGHFCDWHFARNVMEVKQYLSRCLRNMEPLLRGLPDVILVDAGARNSEIKLELERWTTRHPRLRRVKIVSHANLSWLPRLWSRWMLRERSIAVVAHQPQPAVLCTRSIQERG